MVFFLTNRKDMDTNNYLTKINEIAIDKIFINYRTTVCSR